MRKGTGRNIPPITYVPVVDEVQEAITKGKDFSYKIKLPDKTDFSVPILPIWNSGTQEAFLIHVQQAKSACKRKGLFQDYNDAIEAEMKSVEQAKSLRKAIANVIEPKSKKDAEDPNQSTPDDLKASLKDALLTKKVVLEAQTTAADSFFLLNANLLGKNARFCWDKIVSSQVGAAPWTDLQGNKHKKEHGKSMKSFQDCITFHLLDMSPGNAAKQQRFFISNVLKKPQRVPVRSHYPILSRNH